ncbi:bifunctional DNA primase/polymerase [Paracoccus liaowanqingii]|uniref:bifunctional DNA primase/polymerase n=1 Tax=Paracoccus liaowanqingii TaxID=2560053 RepID=UPI00159BEE38|nr:bifunctional DNA primase/polymerase [Paracoccus liaowanqingii]
MGIFAEHQPIYASYNIPTFPVRITADQKKPATVGYRKLGIPSSQQLALKFPDLDAFAFMAGKRAKITVLDIDSPDENLLRDMMKRHGQTPIIVRSGSGNFHAWYRFNGEARAVRPDPSIPVDLLGGGVVIAPPSKGMRRSRPIVISLAVQVLGAPGWRFGLRECSE